MNQQILHASLLVTDYDEAIAFYVGKLQFNLVEDTLIDESDAGACKRWVVVAPQGIGAMSLLLAKATTPEQLARVGDQTGGRVFLFLATDDFSRDYEHMVSNGVKFVREPEAQAYGTVAVFTDPFGNLWDLLEPGPKHLLYEKINSGI